MTATNNLQTIGWREWIQMSDLGVHQIKAKVDTGARTSALHAFHVRPYEQDGIQRVEFKLHPHQRDDETNVVCSAPVIDQRDVTDSGGHREKRWVIMPTITLGNSTFPIEMTLTARDDMRFRMLLGRTAMHGRFVVDPARSYLLGKRKKKTAM